MQKAGGLVTVDTDFGPLFCGPPLLPGIGVAWLPWAAIIGGHLGGGNAK